MHSGLRVFHFDKGIVQQQAVDRFVAQGQAVRAAAQQEQRIFGAGPSVGAQQTLKFTSSANAQPPRMSCQLVEYQPGAAAQM
jgi:hypothetical protein